MFIAHVYSHTRLAKSNVHINQTVCEPKGFRAYSFSIDVPSPWRLTTARRHGTRWVPNSRGYPLSRLCKCRRERWQRGGGGGGSEGLGRHDNVLFVSPSATYCTRVSLARNKLHSGFFSFFPFIFSSLLSTLDNRFFTTFLLPIRHFYPGSIKFSPRTYASNFNRLADGSRSKIRRRWRIFTRCKIPARFF